MGDQWIKPWDWELGVIIKKRQCIWPLVLGLLFLPKFLNISTEFMAMMQAAAQAAYHERFIH